MKNFDIKDGNIIKTNSNVFPKPNHEHKFDENSKMYDGCET